MVVLNLKRYAEELKIAVESSDDEKTEELKNKLRSFIKRKEHMRTQIVNYLKKDKQIQSSTSCSNFVESLEQESQNVKL